MSRAAPAPVPATVAPPPGLTPEQSENFTKLQPAVQGRLAAAPLEMQQLILNTMGMALARGFTLKNAEMFSAGSPTERLVKLAALPLEKQNKALDAVLAASVASDAVVAAKGTPEYDKAVAEYTKIDEEKWALFEEVGLTTKKPVSAIQPAVAAQAGGRRTKKARKMNFRKSSRKASSKTTRKAYRKAIHKASRR
jgi:hypothetical protein